MWHVTEKDIIMYSSHSLYSRVCGMTYGMSRRRKCKETVGMSFTLGNIPQNVMCPLQEIYRTCKMECPLQIMYYRSIGNFTFCPVSSLSSKHQQNRVVVEGEK